VEGAMDTGTVIVERLRKEKQLISEGDTMVN
jgi:hypothetical protein